MKVLCGRCRPATVLVSTPPSSSPLTAPYAPPSVPGPGPPCSACAWFGLAHDLLRFPQNEIDKGVLQMRQKALDKAKGDIFWGLNPDSLPVIKKEEFKARVAAGAQWVLLDGFVLDVEKFMVRAPGLSAWTASVCRGPPPPCRLRHRHLTRVDDIHSPFHDPRPHTPLFLLPRSLCTPGVRAC